MNEDRLQTDRRSVRETEIAVYLPKIRKALVWTLLHLVLILLLLVVLYPLYWTLMMSLKSEASAFKWPPAFIFVPDFLNYIKLLVESDFPIKMLNSLIAAGGATVAAIVIGTPAAYALSRMRSRRKNEILLIVLASRMAPPIAFIIPYYFIYMESGLMDTRLGLVIIYTAFSLGLVVWSMWIYIDEIPRQLDEAAEVDGASQIQILMSIIIPVAVGGLTATGILVFIMAWNDFLFALVLTEIRAVTAPVQIATFLGYESIDLGKAAAGALLVGTPAIIFSVFVRRYLQRGLLGGAVKG